MIPELIELCDRLESGEKDIKEVPDDALKELLHDFIEIKEVTYPNEYVWFMADDERRRRKDTIIKKPFNFKEM